MHNLPPHLQDTESYIIAHMSVPEIEELSKIQGKKILDPATNYPSFLPLGEIIGHRKMSPYIDNFKREYMAANRDPHSGLEGAIRKSGRYGDTEAVILPRNLADIFDQLLYGGAQPGNPHTGKREYFLGGLLNSIGSFFSPIKNALSPIMNTIGSGISSVFNAAQPMLKQMAPMAGQMAAPLISQGLQAAGQRFGIPAPISQGIAGTIGQTAGNMISSFGQGGDNSGGAPSSALDILKQGASSLLDKTLPSISGAAQGAAQNLGNRINPTAGTVLGDITSGLVNNMGSMASSALQGGSMPSMNEMGSGALNAVQNAAQNQIPNIQNPLARAAAEGGMNAVSQFRGGANPLEALQQGFSNISPEALSGAQNYASSGLSSLIDSLLPEIEEAAPMLMAAI